MAKARIIQLTVPRNRAPVEAIRDADLVIDMDGRVIKERDRARSQPRFATYDEKQRARKVGRPR